jgi:hypothetical protein
MATCPPQQKDKDRPRCIEAVRRPPEGGRGYHRQWTFSSFVVAACGLVGCAARWFPKTTTRFCVMIGIGPHVTTSLASSVVAINRSSHVFGMDLAAAEGSKISHSKHLLLVCGTFGCRELSIERTTWSAFLYSSFPAPLTNGDVRAQQKDRPRCSEAVRRTPTRRRTKIPPPPEDVSCSCFGVGCVRSCRLCGEAASKDDDELLHGDCSWPPRHPSSHSLAWWQPQTFRLSVRVRPSIRTNGTSIRPYVRPWYSGAMGRLVGIVSREDITVYYGSYSTATSDAAAASADLHWLPWLPIAQLLAATWWW